ncbi:TIGR04222 domain-containing membrane protein [Sphingomonas sp. LB-2]|uniref:TIGR04222 domain-containing membrane protein n=1 Tax=Sphingomonas caeni TaxID=2984949 RepID=UPI0022327A24|nr:TIGR04222 domain-containing membrane protein [Sphingomonas caeni]MCW3848314.1 TIGR04222 domain-containing membrane protein [Sphingomonas caeni]
MSPFDLTGGPFLQLYAVLFALAFIAGLIIPGWLRPEGNRPRAVGVDELAWLAGGRTRFADALVARLLSRRALSITGGNRFAPERGVAAENAAERSVLALTPAAPWGTIERTLRPHGEAIQERLVASGLLMDGGTTLQMRFWQTLPYLLLIGFGAIKLDVGLARGKPIGFLAIFLTVTAIFALVRFLAVDRKTHGGREALAEARSEADRLRRAPATDETDMAVALFGTAVLAGSSWAPFHQMRSASSSGDGGASSGSDGGGGCGGGGGGGGCGGCGGS